jgi:hypothetical protein
LQIYEGLSSSAFAPRLSASGRREIRRLMDYLGPRCRVRRVPLPNEPSLLL